MQKQNKKSRVRKACQKEELKKELPGWQIVNLTHPLRTSKTISEKVKKSGGRGIKLFDGFNTKNNQLACPLGFLFSRDFSNFQVPGPSRFLGPRGPVFFRDFPGQLTEKYL